MEAGEFVSETVKPGAVPLSAGRPMAPHVALPIVARGINIRLQRRMYFEDEQAANAAGPIAHKMRIPTLIAK